MRLSCAGESREVVKTLARVILYPQVDVNFVFTTLFANHSRNEDITAVTRNVQVQFCKIWQNVYTSFCSISGFVILPATG